MGNHCTNLPRKSPMDTQKKSKVLSCDPANARRHLSGQGDVKYATSLASATHQATPQGIHYSGASTATTPIAKQIYSIGTWNVCGLIQDGKLSIIETEMQRKKIDILGLSETHRRGSGYFTSDMGNTVYFSGLEYESNRGVAFIEVDVVAEMVV
ncbi:unnamed protein product [Parnassius apollo]|uniref:(apollo) hypothetical protein n=1 Tax=Parnassius apollo TaxID=110799 RepID=A0A8S3WVL8_PARAO|nr:unnamed protein product [Parnassius apollo]